MSMPALPYPTLPPTTPVMYFDNSAADFTVQAESGSGMLCSRLKRNAPAVASSLNSQGKQPHTASPSRGHSQHTNVLLDGIARAR